MSYRKNYNGKSTSKSERNFKVQEEAMRKMETERLNIEKEKEQKEKIELTKLQLVEKKMEIESKIESELVGIEKKYIYLNKGIASIRDCSINDIIWNSRNKKEKFIYCPFHTQFTTNTYLNSFSTVASSLNDNVLIYGVINDKNQVFDLCKKFDDDYQTFNSNLNKYIELFIGKKKESANVSSSASSSIESITGKLFSSISSYNRILNQITEIQNEINFNREKISDMRKTIQNDFSNVDDFSEQEKILDESEKINNTKIYFPENVKLRIPKLKRNELFYSNKIYILNFD